MQRRRLNFLLISTLIPWLLTLTASVQGQSRPTPPGTDITSTTELSKEQQDKVKAWSDYYTGVLKAASSKPEEIEAARAELRRPLDNPPPISIIFRYHYSSVVVPELEKVITSSNNIHACVNALLALSLLESDRAANLLLNNTHSQDQKKWQLRLQAAFGCEMILKSDVLEPRTYKTAAKQLAQAAKVESNPMILRHQLAAIDIADHASLKSEDRQAIRQELADALSAVIDRVVKSGPGNNPQEMFSTITSGILLLRDKWIGKSMAEPELRTIGQKIGGSLGQLLSYSAAHWEDGHADEKSKRTYEVLISACEAFLDRIDRVVRPSGTPQTKLAPAWAGNDKTKYQADLELWLAPLRLSPYEQH